MKKLLPLLFLLACGPESSEDNRVCIVNDAFNQTPETVAELEEAAEGTDVELSPDATTGTLNEGQIAICGTIVDINAIVAGAVPTNDVLQDFLAGGKSLN